MGSEKYILDKDNNPVLEKNVLKWGIWLEKSDRHVSSTHIDTVHVSTVFLGLDHNYGDGPPILWETMIFGGENGEYQERYSSHSDAVAGHNKAVSAVLNNIKL